MEVLSPSDLWRDRNADTVPFGASEVRTEISDGRCCREMYFTAMLVEESAVRVFCRLTTPEGANQPLPVVVICEDLGVDFAARDIAKYLDKGFAVFQYDYSGVGESASRYTFYPQELAFANYRLSPDSAVEVTASLEQNCWYVWSIVSLRAVAYAMTLSDIDAERVSIVGIGAGGAHALKACVRYPEINRAVLKFDITLPITCNSNDAINILTSLDSSGCVRLVSTPLLIELASNESNGSFDRMTALYEMCASVCKRLAVSAGENHAIGPEQADNEMLWLSGVEAPLPPVLKAKASSGKLYFDVNVDGGSVPTRVDVFFSAGIADPTFRFWERRKVERAGEDSYIANVSVSDIDDVCYAFAGVSYSSGYYFSSPPVRVVPRTMNIEPAPPTNTRILFDTDMGTDCWIVRGKNAYSANAISIVSGPFEIEGVTSAVGELSMLKIGDKRYQGEGTVLQINIVSQSAQTVKFSVIDSEVTVFECEEDVPAVWSKLSLSTRDFHGKGELFWENARCLTIEFDQPVIISTMLWI